MDNVTKYLINNVGKTYDKILLSVLTDNVYFPFGKIKGYKKVKVPRYLTIVVPKIEWRHYSYSEYGSDYEGILIYFDRVRICRIGSKWEKQPVYSKPKKSSQIKFKRYGE